MSDEPILPSTREGVATLTPNRPKALNSVNSPLIEAIRNALRALAKDSSVRVLVMTAAGRGFCAGADLASKEFQDGVERMAGESFGHSMEIAFNPLISDLVTFP